MTFSFFRIQHGKQRKISWCQYNSITITATNTRVPNRKHQHVSNCGTIALPAASSHKGSIVKGRETAQNAVSEKNIVLKLPEHMPCTHVYMFAFQDMHFQKILHHITVPKIKIHIFPSKRIFCSLTSWNILKWCNLSCYGTEFLTQFWMLMYLNNTWSALSIGTLSSKVSYIFLFLNALFRSMRRNVCRSIPHRAPSVTAWIVAARGMLYKRASSPKLPLPSYVWTCFGSPPGSVDTDALNFPLKTKPILVTVFLAYCPVPSSKSVLGSLLQHIKLHKLLNFGSTRQIIFIQQPTLTQFCLRSY